MVRQKVAKVWADMLGKEVRGNKNNDGNEGTQITESLQFWRKYKEEKLMQHSKWKSEWRICVKLERNGVKENWEESERLMKEVRQKPSHRITEFQRGKRQNYIFKYSILGKLSFSETSRVYHSRSEPEWPIISYIPVKLLNLDNMKQAGESGGRREQSKLQISLQQRIITDK